MRKLWRPREIIVNRAVLDDPVTAYLLEQCPGVPVRKVASGRAEAVKAASEILSGCRGQPLLRQILAGKQVLYLAPPGQAVDIFQMPDERLVCPDFDRLKLAANGCFYRCDWCYLKLTYRAAFPFMTVRVGYRRIQEQLSRKLARAGRPLIFNSGELADSLALEHLTRAGREFIPWFGEIGNGYLFMLTKSDNVDAILDLPHNRHTIIAFSLNAPEVSRRFELGAPSFTRRLAAARKVQAAGYRLRLRLDPLVPVAGWRDLYAETIAKIMSELEPERITLGTLRFEPAFYNLRHCLFATGPELPALLEQMAPMLPPRPGSGGRPRIGKYSFADALRAELFSFALHEIRKYDRRVRIALCKETAPIWQRSGLNPDRCSCVCQLDDNLD